MDLAPRRIGGARVLRWTAIDERHEPTAACRHVVHGERSGPAAGLAICRLEGEDAVRLFGCDADWNILTDTWHETFQGALEQAEFEYAGVTSTWRSHARRPGLPLDPASLTPESARFAARLFDAVPEARAFARMEGTESADLFVEIPSPTGDPERALVLWMEDGGEPSVGFGDWHTHATLWDDDGAVVDLVRAALEDQFVLAYDVGGEFDGRGGVLDLREHDALMDELTNPHGPGRLRIRTWSGRGDREVGAEDFG